MVYPKDRDEVIETNGRIKVTLAKKQSADTVRMSVEEIHRLSGGKKHDFLLDASNILMGDGTGLPEAIELIKQVPYKRIAAFGAKPKFANLGIKELFASIDKPAKVKFFRKEEDALAWLKDSPKT